MADLTYTVDVNVTPAQKNIDALNKKVLALNKTFDGLKTAINGIAFGAMLREINSFALAMDQVAKSTGVSLETINNFSDAVGSLGGNSQKAIGDVQDFVAGLYDAKNGSASAQAELSKIGITLNDLATLSNEDIFKKTIDGLAKIEDASVRNALAVKMLGKNFKDLDVRSVQEAMAGGGGGAGTAAIRAAADAQLAIVKNIDNLRNAILEAVQPLNELIAKINISTDAFKNFIKIALEIGLVFLALTRGLTIVNAMGTAIAGLGATMAGLGALFARIGANIGQVFSNLARALGILETRYGGVVSVGFAFLALLRGLLRFAGLAGIITAIADALSYLEKSIFDTSYISKFFDLIAQGIEELGFLIGKIPLIGEPFAYLAKQARAARLGMGEVGDETEAETKRLKRQNDEIDKSKQARQKVIDASRAQALEADKIVRTYQLQNQSMIEQLGLQVGLIGKTEEEQQRITKLFEIQTAYQNEVNALKTKYTDLQEAAKVGTDEEKAAFQAFAAVYQPTLDKITKEYESQKQVVSKLLDTEMVLKAQEKDRENIIDAITKQMERQATLADQLRTANDKMKDVQFETAQMGRSPLEKQFAQIQEDARKAALEAGRAFSAGFADMDLTTEQAKELADGLDQIAQRYKAIADQQTQNLQQSRTFAQGWKDAFDEYMDNATNAAKRAGEIFNSVTNNMNSAIDKFVETGKFSFSDFARSVIQDLIKIELKAQATQLMKTLGGGGGLFSAIGSFLGFAEGGNPPINKPSIVGENGPELFVPKQAGTIIPNGASLPQQPAQVNNTYITNNISAIDSKSVAQLFAENRKTLLGTVQLAQKELPYANR